MPPRYRTLTGALDPDWDDAEPPYGDSTRHALSVRNGLFGDKGLHPTISAGKNAAGPVGLRIGEGMLPVSVNGQGYADLGRCPACSRQEVRTAGSQSVFFSPRFRGGVCGHRRSWEPTCSPAHFPDPHGHYTLSGFPRPGESGSKKKFLATFFRKTGGSGSFALHPPEGIVISGTPAGELARSVSSTTSARADNTRRILRRSRPARP